MINDRAYGFWQVIRDRNIRQDKKDSKKAAKDKNHEDIVLSDALEDGSLFHRSEEHYRCCKPKFKYSSICVVDMCIRYQKSPY